MFSLFLLLLVAVGTLCCSGPSLVAFGWFGTRVGVRGLFVGSTSIDKCYACVQVKYMVWRHYGIYLMVMPPCGELGVGTSRIPRSVLFFVLQTLFDTFRV